MGSANYQAFNVTLSAATFSRLAQANPFNKSRPADHALELIRVAVYTMYPPHTADEWRDKSRYQGAIRHVLLTSYDLVCYLVRRLIGRQNDVATQATQPTELTLKVPLGLVKWIEKIAQDRAMTLTEAIVFAIEYGRQVLDSQPKEAETLSKVWRDIIQAMWKHSRD